jgi:hypothetical protein
MSVTYLSCYVNLFLSYTSKQLSMYATRLDRREKPISVAHTFRSSLHQTDFCCTHILLFPTSNRFLLHTPSALPHIKPISVAHTFCSSYIKPISVAHTFRSSLHQTDFYCTHLLLFSPLNSVLKYVFPWKTLPLVNDYLELLIDDRKMRSEPDRLRHNTDRVQPK